MKASLVGAAAAVLSFCLASCPLGTGSTTRSQEMLFVAWSLSGPGMASSYLIDPQGGALTEAPGSPYPTGSTLSPPTALTLARGGRFLYMADPASGDPALAGFYVNAFTAAANPLPLFNGGVTNNPSIVTTDATGEIVLVPSGLSGALVAFLMDPVAGTLTGLPATATVTGGSTTVAVDPAGRFVYATDPTTVIVGCVVDPISGVSLNPGFVAPASVIVNPRSAAIDPQGRLYYLAAGGTIEAYAIDASTGALTMVYQDSSLPQGGPDFIVIDPTGRFLYSLDAAGTVSAYAINDTTGALSPVGAPVPIPGTNNGQLQPVLDPSGAFLYVSQSAGALRDFYCFAINKATGAIVPGSAVQTVIPAASSIAAMHAGTVTVPSPY